MFTALSLSAYLFVSQQRLEQATVASQPQYGDVGRQAAWYDGLPRRAAPNGAEPRDDTFAVLLAPSGHACVLSCPAAHVIAGADDVV